MSKQHELCIFCNLSKQRIFSENATALAVLDAYPVNPGHSLIIPKRHLLSYFELRPEEELDLTNLLKQTKLYLDERHHPDGYNVGFNDGVAAGQTVMHMHMHLIPRYVGDILEPRGGIRWVLPERAKYWS
jgi:diadenosine tetraphosphate (Ap4A) HIT family hydrolase